MADDKAQERAILESKYGKPELLNQAADRAVLSGRLKAEAVQDLVDLYGPKCIVDAKTLAVTLDGLPLDEAVAALIEKRPHWKPSAGAVADAEQQARKELEALALSGNVTAHGRLAKAMGVFDYQKWCEDHGAFAGKSAVAVKTEDGKPAGGDHRTNPFHKSNWNVTAQSKLVTAVGVEKAAQIAAAVGVKIGETKPNPNF